MNVVMNDLLIGVKASAINDVVKRVYDSCPFLFTGKVQQEKFTMTWKFLNAPITDFSPASLERARSYYTNKLKLSNLLQETYYQDLLNYAENEGPGFIVKVKQLEMVLSEQGEQPDSADATTPRFDISLFVRADMNPELHFAIYNIVMDEAYVKNPSDKKYFEKYVMPAIKDGMNGILNGLNIPPISWNKLKMGKPVIKFLENSMLLDYSISSDKPLESATVTENLGSKGFIIMISSRLIDKLIQSSDIFPISISDGQKETATPLFAEWHYHFRLDVSTTRIDGCSVKVNISSSAGAGAEAGMEIPCMPPLGVGISLKLGLTNSPVVEMSVAINGRKVGINFKSASNFAVYCEPDGSPVTWIISSLPALVINPILASSTYMIAQSLRRINIPVMFEIPTITLSMEDTKLYFGPSDLSVSNIQGKLCLEGNFALSSHSTEV